MGIGVLGTMLTLNYLDFRDNPGWLASRIEWTTLLLRNGPTYAFVVLCESLALIMFRYQSKALEYMRYFSNEGTNLDARRIAFLTALHYEDGDTVKNLISQLERTERNFLIDKNQRTLEMANNSAEDRLLERLLYRLSLSSTDKEDGNSDVATKKSRTRKSDRAPTS
jgi:hypothetical protein